MSLSRDVAGVPHEHAEHRRRLFAAVAAQEPDLPRVDSVAEVRALREDRAEDAARSERSESQPGHVP